MIAVLRRYLLKRLNFQEDQANENEIIQNVKNNTEFSGPYLLTLVFAIFMASIGLNVNSTAVIIGAMLISPLMGPIIGIGTAIGINDFELLKSGLKNFFIATLISIITSSIYFIISPLSEAQSELLARTTPSIYDVLIGFFGGSAGMLAITRREKSNVIPGVAIATALMPPLCTAGYGIANGNLTFVGGALYLFFINSVFICISTYLITRLINLTRKEFENEKIRKRKISYIWAIILVTFIPSVFLTYGLVQQSLFENNAKRFVDETFKFDHSQIINRSYKYQEDTSVIQLLVLGEDIGDQQIDSLKKLLPYYGLKKTKLIVRQGLDAKNEVDLSQIKASILEEIGKNDSSSHPLSNHIQNMTVQRKVANEIKVLFPTITNFSLNKEVIVDIQKNDKQDTLVSFIYQSERKLKDEDSEKLRAWLQEKYEEDSVDVIYR